MDLVRFIFIFYFVRLSLCNKYSDDIMTFISIHSVIICVAFFGAYMRCTRLCPLNPGVTKHLCHVEISVGASRPNLTWPWNNSDSEIVQCGKLCQ
jgi:hypothetical protein